MNKLNNYVLATTCLVILVGAFALVGGPLVQQGQALPPDRYVTVVNTPENPVPVVVQNGDADGNVVVTLAENLTLSPGDVMEFPPVDVSDFRWVSLLGSTSSLITQTILGFSTEPGALSDSSLPNLVSANCEFGPEAGVWGVKNCRSFGSGASGIGPGWLDGVHRIGGPFLLVRLENGLTTSTVTLKACLSR